MISKRLVSLCLILSTVDLSHQSKNTDAILTSLKNLVIDNSHTTVTLNSTALRTLIAISKAEKSNGISKNIYLSDKETVKYDRVLTNIGNGYDKISGHFKAPIKGLYVFSCTVMAVERGDLSVVLVKNAQEMSHVYSSTGIYESGAISILLSLKKGDKVWIRRYGHGRTMNKDYSWFTGYLISTMI
uniref:Complement C1q-like protein 4 isoform X2 n=1 Tax=Crassostrea virginica TaxID=6565 RepID=A0A8B8B822_CRAVI|nr:complement C1q-like protein 4 isoform X2 [Crassostrea virginica]